MLGDVNVQIRLETYPMGLLAALNVNQEKKNAM
jgi:hypothetical protein